MITSTSWNSRIYVAKIALTTTLTNLSGISSVIISVLGIRFPGHFLLTPIVPKMAALADHNLPSCDPISRDPFRTKNSTALEAVVFYYCCRFLNYLYGFPASSQKIQQFPRVTSIGSLPPKNLGKSRRPPQSPAEPSERPRRAPQSPLRGKFARRASWRVVPLGW